MGTQGRNRFLLLQNYPILPRSSAASLPRLAAPSWVSETPGGDGASIAFPPTLHPLALTKMCVRGGHNSFEKPRTKTPKFKVFCGLFVFAFSFVSVSVDDSQMPRVGALMVKLKPSPFCPSFSSYWTVGRGGQKAGLSHGWSSCCISPLFSDSH